MGSIPSTLVSCKHGEAIRSSLFCSVLYGSQRLVTAVYYYQTELVVPLPEDIVEDIVENIVYLYSYLFVTQ